VGKWGIKFTIQPPSLANIRNEWNYTYTPPVCLYGLYTDNCTFTFHLILGGDG
jgi:hypothetical protein